MSREIENYLKVGNTNTGSHENVVNSRIVKYPFGRYVISIRLGDFDKFLGVEEIAIEKEFASQVMKKMNLVTDDVRKYYDDEE